MHRTILGCSISPSHGDNTYISHIHILSIMPLKIEFSNPNVRKKPIRNSNEAITGRITQKRLRK